MKRKPDPRRSEGARVERKEFREYWRRKLTEGAQREDLNIILDWVLASQKRYNKRPVGRIIEPPKPFSIGDVIIPSVEGLRSGTFGSEPLATVIRGTRKGLLVIQRQNLKTDDTVHPSLWIPLRLARKHKTR